MSCSELFTFTHQHSGFSKIQKELSSVRRPSPEAQKILEVIQSIHDFRVKSPKDSLPSQPLNLLKDHLKTLTKKFANFDNYKKVSDPDGGIPALILSDKKLALFLIEQITKNTAHKATSRQILHSILSLAVLHFPDEYMFTNFYNVLRQTLDESRLDRTRDQLSEVSEPVIFYDGLFIGDLKNLGGEDAYQIQKQTSYLNRMVSRKVLSPTIARSVFEKQILNINPLPLNNAERQALVKALKIEDRHINVKDILELIGFKLADTEDLTIEDQSYPYPIYRTKSILKFENDPGVSISFIIDTIYLPEEIAETQQTTYTLKGVDLVEAFMQSKKPNTTLEIHATTTYGQPN